MPRQLLIDNEVRQQRHVLGQQMYRLRKRYKWLIKNNLKVSAKYVLREIETRRAEWYALGGLPVHKGNQL